MRNPVNKSILSFFALSLLTSINVFAAPDVSEEVTVRSYDGIRYVRGGIGDEQQQAVKSLSSDFSLKITLASQQGNYLSGVDVQIADTQGKTVLELSDVGPLLNVDVPTGTYKVEFTPVEFEGESQSHRIDVADEGYILNAVWNLQ